MSLKKGFDNMFNKFCDDEQLNLQFNRPLAFGYSEAMICDIKEIVPKVKDMETWYEQWLIIAKKAEIAGRYSDAAYYYRMAEFYLKEDRVEKLECFYKFKVNFYMAHKNDSMELFSIPYENTYMPAIRFKAKEEKGIILIHGGYDSIIEECCLTFKEFCEKGYTLIYFDGPGQGQTLKNGLKLCFDWEKPTSAVIDYFNLDNVTLLGISLGGYLCLRAAAFEKRIKNVICDDIFYCMLDSLTMKMPSNYKEMFFNLLNNNEKQRLNDIFEEKMKNSLDLRWKLNNGMYITGSDTPFDFLKNAEKYTVEGVQDKVTQNVLLLAGEEDQYVPLERMDTLKKELVNAKSITSRVFTIEEGGEQHCQAGNINLVISEVLDFLEKVR